MLESRYPKPRMAGAAWWLALRARLPCCRNRSSGSPVIPQAAHRPEEWLSPRSGSSSKNGGVGTRSGDRRCPARAARQGTRLRMPTGPSPGSGRNASAPASGSNCAPRSGAGIVQFAFSTPERLRSRGRSTKHCHRRALRDILPRSVLDRTTKADFMVTFSWQIADIGAELRSVVSRRRSGWVRLEQALSLSTTASRPRPEARPSGNYGHSPDATRWYSDIELAPARPGRCGGGIGKHACRRRPSREARRRAGRTDEEALSPTPTAALRLRHSADAIRDEERGRRTGKGPLPVGGGAWSPTGAELVFTWRAAAAGGGRGSAVS